MQENVSTMLKSTSTAHDCLALQNKRGIDYEPIPRLLLFMPLFAEIAGCECCLHGPEAPARAASGRRTHHPAHSAPFAVRPHSAASFLPRHAPLIPSGP